jgi:hypothetical protein
MASPHVAGAAAIYLGLNPGASVAQVASYLDAESTRNALSDLKASTVNKLLYVSPTDGGAPIVPPVVAQRSVTNITHESADVLIDVNPGFASTTLSFEYGVDRTFATNLTAPVVPGVIDGQTPTTATVKLAGLSASVTYSFRIIGVNESGRTVSDIGSFTTLAPPKISPIASVSQATDITAYSATLNGGAQAGNDSTKVSFMYGTDPEFKVNTNNIAASPFILSSGNTLQNVNLSVSFLDGGKKYYYNHVRGVEGGDGAAGGVRRSIVGRVPVWACCSSSSGSCWRRRPLPTAVRSQTFHPSASGPSSSSSPCSRRARSW